MRLILLTLFAAFFCLEKASAINEDFMTTLNVGWPYQLQAMDQATNDGRSYIVVLSLLPEPAIDIASAETLRRSLIEVAADGDESILGHVMFGWKCSTKNGFYQGMSGMTGENHGQIYKMTKSGWGYNAMMSTFTDGHLQEPREIEKYQIAKNLAGGKSFVTLGIEVTQDECMNFYNALYAFVTHPNVPMSRFGSMTSPDQYTGGGCISTALSLLGKSKAFPVADHFKRHMKFNKKFLGRGDTPPKKTELPDPAYWQDRKYISFDTFVFSSWEVKPTDQYISVDTEDPELLLAFLKTVIAVSTNSGQTPAQMTSRLFKSIQPDPSGEDAFGVNRRFSWTQYTKTAANDASYMEMYKLANSWLVQRGSQEVIKLNLLGQPSAILKKVPGPVSGRGAE